MREIESKSYLVILCLSFVRRNLLNQNYKHLFLNSNPWFSAVTDYSYQLCLFLYQTENILYCAESGSTAMDEKCKHIGIPFKNIPIHNQSLYNFLFCIISIFLILIKNRKSLKYIWVFEGREHTLCCLLKILFPNLFKNIKIIRIRGQAQKVKNNIFSKVVYNLLTDKIILAAECVKNRFNFKINSKKFLIHYYCKDTKVTQNTVVNYIFDEDFPVINKDNLIFLVIGRFDLVKGHNYLIKSFLKAKLKPGAKLVLLGYKANLSPYDIYQKFLPEFGSGKFNNNIFYLEKSDENKQLFIIEKKISDLENLMSVVSFGVIPSLDSEVICRVGVEFLQSSIPVLHSDAGALSEVFSDFSELKFQLKNENELIRKLEKASEFFSQVDKLKLLKEKAFEVGNNKFSLKNYKNIVSFIDSQ